MPSVPRPPKSLSPSSVSTFRYCPRAYRYSYVDRIPQPPTIAASKGTLVHRALELHYERPAAERTPEALAIDSATAAIELRPMPEFVGLELTDEGWETFVHDADVLAQRIFQIEDPTQIHPIGLELKMETSNNGATLRGIIDRLELDEEGELVVTDYKTGSVPGERFEASKLQGVHFYSVLCDAVLGKRPARVQLIYLSKPEAIIATPSEQSVRGAKQKIGAIWTAVERAYTNNDFRPNPGKLCQWCSYRDRCPAVGGTDTE